MNRALASQNDPVLAHVLTDHWKPIMLSISGVVAHAVQRGQAAPDVAPDVVVQLIVGPLLMTTAFMGTRPSEQHIDALAHAVLRMTEPRRGGRDASPER